MLRERSYHRCVQKERGLAQGGIDAVSAQRVITHTLYASHTDTHTHCAHHTVTYTSCTSPCTQTHTCRPPILRQDSWCPHCPFLLPGPPWKQALLDLAGWMAVVGELLCLPAILPRDFSEQEAGSHHGNGSLSSPPTSAGCCFAGVHVQPQASLGHFKVTFFARYQSIQTRSTWSFHGVSQACPGLLLNLESCRQSLLRLPLTECPASCPGQGGHTREMSWEPAVDNLEHVCYGVTKRLL